MLSVRSLALLALIPLCLLARMATAEPLRESDVPPPLRPWIPWVLHEADDRACPFAYNTAAPKRCVWPGVLALELGARGGRFNLRVETFRPLFVPLPGDAAFWPQELQVDGKPASVVARAGLPGVMLPAGSFSMSGRFIWDRVPENLRVPPEIGLVQLTLEGRAIAAPRFDEQGRLWLQSEADTTRADARLDVRIERLLSDDIPFQVTTHFSLTASGPSQEVALPGAVLADFVPLSLSSVLPARLDNGALRVQVRAGRWDVYVVARSAAPVATLALPKQQAQAAEEIWAFAAQNRLRVVNVEGGTPVDPQQTQLLPQWKSFPAFRVRPGEALRFVEIKRGDPQPAPDALGLARTAWLDFDGRGYTIQDKITGTLSRSWRLEAAAPMVLGRVAIDGLDQFITRGIGGTTGDGANTGVEVRQGRANIVADSRIDEPARALSATGWTNDFQSVSMQLNLPPGWRLFTATGADRVVGSWLGHWSNLLDFFIVLVTALAAGKLWGWRWGLVALAALVLSYYEAGAPGSLWLFALLAAALARVVTTGRAGVAVTALRRLTLLALLVLLIPFAVQQVRQTLYPVLEEPYLAVGDMQRGAVATGGAFATGAPEAQAPAAQAPAAPPVEEPKDAMADKRTEEREEKSGVAGQLRSRADSSLPSKVARRAGPLYQSAELDRVDPKAMIQTGPGLPQWGWRSHQLSWSGPVQAAQPLDLWLISPPVNALLAVVRLLLLALLFVRVADATLWLPQWPRRSGTAAASRVLACVVLSGLLVLPQNARAEATPAPELLRELKEKLLQPPACAPHCAEIARMQLSVAGEALRIRLEVHAAAPVAIPLSAAARQWVPVDVLLDGQRAVALARDEGGSLWMRVPQGVHQILLQGALAGLDAVQLSLPLKPHRVEADTPGWTLEGIRENGVADTALQLTRRQRAAANEFKSQNLPSLLRVERTLLLGLQWQVHTRVTRLSPANVPVLVEVPLLAGEAVTSAEPRVENGRALVSLGPNGREIAWESSLKEAPEIALVAAKQSNFVEVWRLNAGTPWHVEVSGLAPVQHQDSGRWLPQWQPWPGERVGFKVAKPEGVPGQTLTVDRSLLQVKPGIRASDATLSLTLRSSRGGQHTLLLPPDAVLQRISINGELQPIRLEGNELRLPILPGAQEIEAQWQQPVGLTMRYAAPAVDVGIGSVNARTQVLVPHDRWLLFVVGPTIGPAILFWGVVIVIVAAAFALARVPLNPVKPWQWLLLGLGLTQASIGVAAIIVAWFFAVALRARYAERLSEKKWLFNLTQVGLVLLTLAAATSLYDAVSHGLLGAPEMQVSGNGSTHNQLNWFQDRASSVLPTPWLISVPILVYRLLMLGWALWLAYSLLKWARWAWQSFSSAGLWRKGKLWTPRSAKRSGPTVGPAAAPAPAAGDAGGGAVV